MKRPFLKRQSRGYTKLDGMHPGGEWFSITSLHYKYIPIASLWHDEAVTGWLAQAYGPEVFVEAYITSGYDKVTNYAGCEMDEWFAEDFEKVLNQCPILTEDAREKVWERLEELASDPDGYEPYNID